MYLLSLGIIFYPLLSGIAGELYISERNSTWNVATKNCGAGVNLVGGDEMNSCQPENCDPTKLIDIKGMSGERDILWVNGYVLRSKLLKYEGCFRISNTSNSSSLTSRTTFEENSVLTCSRYCNIDEKKGHPGYFIYLQDNTCLCVPNKTHLSWNEERIVLRTETKVCSTRCTGYKLDRCGGVDRTKIYSVYVFLQEKLEDSAFGEVGKLCFSIKTDMTIERARCREELNFRCQERFAKDNTTSIRTKCRSEIRSWYDSKSTCRIVNGYIQTNNETECNDGDKNWKPHNGRSWYGKFVAEKIIWNNDKDGIPIDAKCLALGTYRDGTKRLLTLDCNKSYKALCIENTTEEMTNTTSPNNSNENTTEEITNTTSPNNSNEPIAVWTVVTLGIIFLVVAVLVITYKMYLRRRRNNKGHTNDLQNTNPQQQSCNTTIQETTLHEHGNTTDQYEDVDGKTVDKYHETNSVGDIYNHLHDSGETSANDQNIYHHIGNMENDYDLSTTSNRAHVNDNANCLYN